MSSSAAATAHLRVARPTDDIAALLPFYCDGLGYKLLLTFTEHEGFSGVMLGHPGGAYHLEFTCTKSHTAGRAPTQDNLLVLYLPLPTDFDAAVARMEMHGFAAVPSFNPYWDQHGKTFEDPDGYRVVLSNMSNPAQNLGLTQP